MLRSTTHPTGSRRRRRSSSSSSTSPSPGQAPQLASCSQQQRSDSVGITLKPMAAPVIDPADRITRLPEEIQAQILSFLPAQEAVRTCVLARSWRHVWKSTRRLLITGKSVEEVRKFVNRLLRVRRDGLQLASLDASEIRFDLLAEVEEEDEEDVYLTREDMSSIRRWIRQVLECQIQTLQVDISAHGRLDLYLAMSTRPLLDSQHLSRLELTGISFQCIDLNLDGCPALEHLEINECCLANLRKITSLFLKRLLITSCESNGADNRIWIRVPRLVSLLLDDMDFRTPFLERMPELVWAKVDICSYRDRCRCEDPMNCYHVMRTGDTSDTDSASEGDYAGQNTTKCVVLEGLAQAEDLVLIDRCSTWVPSISKYKVEMKGYPNATVRSTKVSQHLKVVEINCEDVNERILDVLKFLGTLKICFGIGVTEKKMMKKQLSH